MDNKTKALDIAMSLIDCELPTLEKCRKSAIQMAEWKNQQFAEEKKLWMSKAHDWLIKNSSKYVGFDESQFLAYAYKTMSDDFIKYMEE